MTDDLHAVRTIERTMTMMKMKSLRLPRIHQSNNGTEFVVMVACDQEHVAISAELLDQAPGFVDRGAIMDEITDHNQMRRIVVAQQFFESLFDCLHSPKRKKIPSGSLAQFVSKMKIGHREPAFPLVKKSQSAIEQDIFANSNWAR